MHVYSCTNLSLQQYHILQSQFHGVTKLGLMLVTIRFLKSLLQLGSVSCGLGGTLCPTLCISFTLLSEGVLASSTESYSGSTLVWLLEH